MALLRYRECVIAAAERNGAGVRLGDAGNETQKRGLAGAVGPAEQGEAAGGCPKRQSSQHAAAAAHAGKIGDDELHGGAVGSRQ
jgi:hypothetical protein